jgi:hypothetical protein
MEDCLNDAIEELSKEKSIIVDIKFVAAEGTAMFKYTALIFYRETAESLKSGD